MSTKDGFGPSTSVRVRSALREVEGDGGGVGRRADEQREAERERRRHARPPARERDGGDEHRDQEREDERGGGDVAERLLEPGRGEERGRVRLAVRGRVAGERHARGQEHDPGGEHAVGEPVRPAARGVEPEEDPDERHRVEEVALLDAVAAEPVRGGLHEQGEHERRGQGAEGELLAGARPAQREPEAERSAGGEDDPGRVARAASRRGRATSPSPARRPPGRGSPRRSRGRGRGRPRRRRARGGRPRRGRAPARAARRGPAAPGGP